MQRMDAEQQIATQTGTSVMKQLPAREKSVI